jgi:hypothetical protein
MAGVLPDLGDCHGRLRLPRNDTGIYRSPSIGTTNYNLPLKTQDLKGEHYERIFWIWGLSAACGGVFILAASDFCDFFDGRDGGIRYFAGQAEQEPPHGEEKPCAAVDGAAHRRL